jgi:hypothetical protein
MELTQWLTPEGIYQGEGSDPLKAQLQWMIPSLQPVLLDGCG